MHKFPIDASLISKWSKAIHVHRADWTGPSSSSRLCSLHFIRGMLRQGNNYEEEDTLRR